MPASASEQLRLAVPGDAGDAHDLAPPHPEADALDPLHPERVVDHDVDHLEHGVARVRRRLVHREG
jgi:hypothetical protein